MGLLDRLIADHKAPGDQVKVTDVEDHNGTESYEVELEPGQRTRTKAVPKKEGNLIDQFLRRAQEADEDGGLSFEVEEVGDMDDLGLELDDEDEGLDDEDEGFDFDEDEDEDVPEGPPEGGDVVFEGEDIDLMAEGLESLLDGIEDDPTREVHIKDVLDRVEGLPDRIMAVPDTGGEEDDEGDDDDELGLDLDELALLDDDLDIDLGMDDDIGKGLDLDMPGTAPMGLEDEEGR